MTPQREQHDDARRYDPLIYRYVMALDRGDLDAIAALVSEAADDPELDRILASVDAALHTDAGLRPIEEDARLVRRLLQQYLPSSVAEPEETSSATSLSISEVAARILSEHAMGQRLTATDEMANRRLLVTNLPIPIPVTAKAIARLADSLQVEASSHYWKRFRETALILGIVRERGEIEIAAARRQTPTRPHPARTGRRYRTPQEEQ
jgi:hypothetical protein